MGETLRFSGKDFKIPKNAQEGAHILESVKPHPDTQRIVFEAKQHVLHRAKRQANKQG